MARELQSSIVTKCTLVLDRLAESPDAMSFTEIVKTTGFNKSSAHRIINILLGEDLISFDPITKTYGLGDRPMRWARSAWQKTDLQQITDSELAQLRDRTGLNVAVSIRNEESIMFIRTLDVRSVRYAAKIGEQAPLHATAAGKVFLAYDPNQEQCGLPDSYELEKLTEHTITNLRSLELDLAKVRQRGFAICDREEFLQISGIAAPIFDYQSRVVASISLWAPTKLANSGDLVEHASELVTFSSDISHRFGSMLA